MASQASRKAPLTSQKTPPDDIRKPFKILNNNTKNLELENAIDVVVDAKPAPTAMAWIGRNSNSTEILGRNEFCSENFPHLGSSSPSSIPTKSLKSLPLRPSLRLSGLASRTTPVNAMCGSTIPGSQNMPRDRSFRLTSKSLNLYAR